MPEVTLKINNRGYSLACDSGQEQRIVDLGHYVDSRLREIAKAGAATNDAHLLVLTALVLADEIYELRDQVSALRAGAPVAEGLSNEDEVAVSHAIEHLALKIESIVTRIQGTEDSVAA